MLPDQSVELQFEECPGESSSLDPERFAQDVNRHGIQVHGIEGTAGDI
jgi:hypothetical protein